jgi:UDP:flavonoid glycosyltransferase YjiC (YdhE family)
MVRHAGPVLEDEKFAVPTVLPWTEDDKTPLVLVSFSTGFEQRNVDKVQRSLDALADLPIHVVATTGGIVAPNEVAAPANAIVLNYAAALRHGTPMVVIPGPAGDQPYVAAAVQEFGAGRALAGDATVEAIRAAAQEVLATPSFTENARKRSAALAGVDGAANAADEIEALLKLKSAAGLARAADRTIACQQVA